MNPESRDSQTEDEEESVDEMMQHLDDAKQLSDHETRRARKTSSASGLQATIQRRSDAAVLSSNYESRLEEMVTHDKVTHRSSKPWASAKAGVEAHGQLPIYYRHNGKVAYKGIISQIVLNPAEKSRADVEEFLDNITDDDTYSDYNDRLDTTTYIVTNGERIDEPFSQSELRKLSGEGTVDEDYSYQPCYVVQRPGDFPNLP